MQNILISGQENGVRLESRILEERIQEAVKAGMRALTVDAFGQHGIGGRLWVSEQEPVSVTVTGASGQRLGSLGCPGTTIEVMGPGSDDIGWLNAGAEITVHGNAGNGICNAMAQGRVFIAGHVGSRCMTMTKQNPRFSAPELWVLGATGDYFAEFMAGGVAVICGVNAPDAANVLGYRPCVGMVGGRIFYRGQEQVVSAADAVHAPILDEDWTWLSENLKLYLNKINKPELFDALADRAGWHMVRAKTPHEKLTKKRLSMADFHAHVWDKELGRGGLVGDLTSVDRSPIGLVTTGELRRFVPVWENCKYMPPCQASCPSGIPVQKRWQLIREGRLAEAVDLSLEYTPFPATVCGYLCPNLCMEGCTRGLGNLKPVDAKMLGKEGINANPPMLPMSSDKKVAVIGGGPAGISVAWQLRLKGHRASVFDMDEKLGGKLQASIPANRIPPEVLAAELDRAREIIPHVRLEKKLNREDFEAIRNDYDFIVLATGAQRPRTLPIPGNERLIPATDFLKSCKHGDATVGGRVVVIGGGNVGCDVASEAGRLGATSLTVIDVQKPASFGKEREEAEKAGAEFLWPCFTKEITAEGVVLTDGRVLPADTVIVSIGDIPDLEAIPDNIARERGFIKVNDVNQTTDPKVFAIGDLVKLGLLTQAIGDGRRAATAIDEIITGKRPLSVTEDMAEELKTRLEYMDPGNHMSETIDYSRMNLAYYDPRLSKFESLDQCADECSSCGVCRDCGICEAVCPRGAISREALPAGEFAMVCDPEKCIGCGFCAGACPCGIWTLIPNTPLG
ncbi:MAG: 4Fe-4S dicluster domain-containing protein [Deltaproteobacteria bacterium]|nr:4Fe-4S dicluster domain-containing protein [Deltaproteobacteria bacterium]